MINLFAEDKTSELEEKQKALQSYFASRCAGGDIDSKLQNRINTWRSLFMYQNIRSENKNIDGISQQINKVFEQQKQTLDSSPQTFTKNLPTQFWQNIFELVMTNLFSKNFSLKTKTLPPDLEFNYLQNTYFVECTARASSLLDRYDNLLPVFNDFFETSMLFLQKNELMKSQFEAWTNPWYLEPSIQQLWHEMDEKEKNFIIEKLDTTDEKEIIEKINNWVFLNRYIGIYFIDIAPEIIIQKLTAINIPLNMISHEEDDIYFRAQCIALMICSKLEKDYFHQNKPGIIAISLSMLSPSICSNNLDRVIEYLLKTFHMTLNIAMKNKPHEIQQKILNGLNNLYAIIIDDCWYNWFPDVVRNLHGAKFPPGYDNSYWVIYNEQLIEDPTYDSDIFKSLIPHRTKAPLSPNLPKQQLDALNFILSTT
jgi:hypothetical protein